MINAQKVQKMHRLGPYFFVLAGLALASSDTLHVGILPVSTPSGVGTLVGLVVSSIGGIWSHRLLSRSLPSRIAAAFNGEEIAKAAAAAVLAQLQKPGADLSGVISKAVTAAAQETGAQLVQHVRDALAGPTGDGEERSTPTPRGPVLEELPRSPVSSPVNGVSAPS